MDWSRGPATASLEITGAGLPFDAALYSALPAAGRKAWDEVQPEGTIDGTFRYRGPLGAAETPANANPAAAGAFDLTLRPRATSPSRCAAPYRLEQVRGVVTVRDGRVKLEDVVGRHGPGTVAIGGVGVLGDKPRWDLHLSARDLPADDALHHALPSTLASLFESLKLSGRIGFDLNKFTYAQSETPAASPRATASAEPQSDLDVSGKILLADAAFEPGVAITEAQGTLDLTASVRRGAFHPARRRAARFAQDGRPGGDGFRRGHRQTGESQRNAVQPPARRRGGRFDGGRRVDLLPQRGPSKYRLSMVVRDADVRALAWESEQEIDGRLTASLALEGSWGDATARRGRGDVLVSGRQMYRIPLVLGLLQVTNLALPISSPFNEASARYSVDGQRVTFEQIRLKSDNMVMSGDGQLDFARKRVSLSFTTDNPGGLKVPFLHELWQGAQCEMLRIRVNGSIEEPKVSASSMGTFWTTVDEVFKGDSPQKRGKN